MKEDLIVSLVCICIGIVIIAVAWYFMSPVFIAIGLLTVITFVIIPIVHKITKKENDEPYFGCGCAVILALGASTLFFTSKEYYVSGIGEKRHIYEDCKFMYEKKRYFKVYELGSILMGCLSDCESCTKRYQEEKEQKRTEWKNKQLQSDIEDIEMKIKILQDVLSRLKKGESIDVADYDFRRDVEIEEEERREELGYGAEYNY